jgi:hypothetical protein
MNTNTLPVLHFPNQDACARTEFYPARLMTPDEVVAATKHHPDHAQVALDKVWALCGDLKERAPAPISSTAVRPPVQRVCKRP